MLEIPPNTSKILEKITLNDDKKKVKKSITMRLFKHLAIGGALSFFVGFSVSLLLNQMHQTLDIILISMPIFICIGLITAKLAIDCFNKENKITDMAFKVIDKSINDIGNEFDTFTSRYLIDFTLLETAIFDQEQVIIKDAQGTTPYHEIRSSILKKYHPSRNPIIPYRTQEYSQYMHLLEHAFKRSKFSNAPLRETLKVHFKKKDR